MNLQERADAIEDIGGGTAYLVVVNPNGGVMVDRLHPDGTYSGIAYGALTSEAEAIRSPLARFRSGSSHEGEW
jgi:hypothetical protein